MRPVFMNDPDILILKQMLWERTSCYTHDESHRKLLLEQTLHALPEMEFEHDEPVEVALKKLMHSVFRRDVPMRGVEEEAGRKQA